MKIFILFGVVDYDGADVLKCFQHLHDALEYGDKHFGMRAHAFNGDPKWLKGEARGYDHYRLESFELE